MVVLQNNYYRTPIIQFFYFSDFFLIPEKKPYFLHVKNCWQHEFRDISIKNFLLIWLFRLDNLDYST